MKVCFQGRIQPGVLHIKGPLKGALKFYKEGTSRNQAPQTGSADGRYPLSESGLNSDHISCILTHLGAIFKGFKYINTRVSFNEIFH